MLTIEKALKRTRTDVEQSPTNRDRNVVMLTLVDEEEEPILLELPPEEKSVLQHIAESAVSAEQDRTVSAQVEAIIRRVVYPALSRTGYTKEDVNPRLRTIMLAAAWEMHARRREDLVDALFARDAYSEDAAVEGKLLHTAESTVKLFAHPVLKIYADDIIETLPAAGLKRFLGYVEGIGWPTVAAFFNDHAEEWNNPAERQSILSQLYFTIYAAKRHAYDKLAQEPMSLDLEEEQKITDVTLTPDEVHDNLFLREEYVDALIEEKDDNDFEIPHEFETATLHHPIDHGVLMRVGRALLRGDRDTLNELLESEVFPSQELTGTTRRADAARQRTKESMDQLCALWRTEDAEQSQDERVETLRGVQEQLKQEIPLPESADTFSVYNRRLNRTRTIPSFDDALRVRMVEVALANAINPSPRIRKVGDEAGSENLQRELIKQLLAVETKARALYKGVVNTGVPVFRDFIHWINEEQKRLGAMYPGEFYVGRDTYQTIYKAADAMRWGTMDAQKRKALTVHVDVSRDLINNMKHVNRKQGRAMLRDWLLKEGVTLDMFGVDGGYSGSSPSAVFRAIDPEHHWDKKEFNRRIRLIETEYQKRRFNPDVAYDGVVSWMESLPKFTERAQLITASDFGKYFTISKKRSPAERVLAWTVQHAVWREFIEKSPLRHAPRMQKSTAENTNPNP